MKVLLLSLLALAAGCAANPLWVHQPYSLPPPTPLVYSPSCRVGFEKIETKFCEPTFEIKCERQKQPSQTIDLKRECHEVPTVVCGSHRHPSDDQDGVLPAVPGEHGSHHGHDADGNVVFDAATATASTAAGTPYIGAYVPYQLRNLASQHCHEVAKEYCYMVPTVRDVDREVRLQDSLSISLVQLPKEGERYFCPLMYSNILAPGWHILES